MKKLSKKLLSAILSVLMVLSVLYAVPLTATAAETETAGVGDVNIYGDYEYGILDDGTAAIAGYTGSATKLDIPSTLDGYTVTCIGDVAFLGCTSLRSVTVPSSVTIISENAFSGCTSLESIAVSAGNRDYCSVDGVLFSKDKTVLICCPEGKTDSYTIPSGVLSIGDFAFCDCTALTSITIPKSVEYIGGYAFSDCTSLTSIKIPESVEYIGVFAFSVCISLESITVADGNSEYRSVDGVLFNNDETVLICYPGGKSGSYTIPSDVKSICDLAFCGSVSLESIYVPESVVSIGYYAFGVCISLKSITVSDDNIAYCSVDGVLFNKDETVLICYPGGKSGSYTIPSNVTSIEDDAFIGCTSLESITISAGIESIGDYAFSECTSLKSVTISAGIESIGDYAFWSCTSLENVIIPEGVESIGYFAFLGCPLKDVYYTGSESQWKSIDIDWYGNDAIELASIHYNYVPSEITKPDLLPGDANGDGVVNVKDATTVQKHVAGLITLEGEALTVADYDNNGTINVKDATAIQKHVAGLI